MSEYIFISDLLWSGSQPKIHFIKNVNSFKMYPLFNLYLNKT